MTALRTFLRWFITPDNSLFNRVCSTVALGLVLAVVALVVGMGVAS